MAENPIIITLPYTADLDRGPVQQYLPMAFGTGDKEAHKIILTAYRSTGIVNLTGAGVLCYVNRADRTTVVVDGEVVDGKAVVVLPEECYVVNGVVSIIVKLTLDDTRATVLWLSGSINRTSNGKLVDPGGVVPTLEALLAEIDNMRTATSASKDATTEALGVIDTANATIEHVKSKTEDAIMDVKRLAAPPIVQMGDGKTIVIPDAVDDRELIGAAVYGNSTQDVAPEPASPVAVSPLVAPVMTLTASDGTVQSIEAAGVTLHGLRTTNAAAAAYTDDDDKRWIADEIDYGRGVIVRRVGVYQVTGAESWAAYGLTGRTYPSYAMVLPGARNEMGNTALCSHYPGLDSYADLYYSRAQAAYVGSDNTANAKLIIGDTYATVDEFKAWLASQYAAGTPVTVVYPLQESVEEPLDDALLASFAALRTSAGMTVEAGGAWVAVQYIVDTKAYVDAAAEEASQYAENAGYAQTAGEAAEADHAADADMVRGTDVIAKLAQTAVGIECSESGSIVQITDGGARRALRVATVIEAVQEGAGDPSPDNVRDISGWDAAKLLRTGRNLIPYPYAEQSKTENGLTYTVNDDGSITVSGTATAPSFFRLGTASSPMDIPNGMQLTISGCPAGGSDKKYQLRITDPMKQVQIATDNGDGKTFVADTAQAYAYIYVASGMTVENLVFSPQLELGAAATDYATYHGQTLTADLPETVYGGCMDWASGTLTVTRKGVQLTGTEDWTELTGVPDGQHAYQWRPGDYATGKLSGLCSHYTVNKLSYRILNAIYFGNRITINVSQETVTDFKAWLAAQYEAGTPVTVVYELAAPYTVQLTPQQLDMLRGYNAVWSNCGETSVAYTADTKIYIDNAIAAALATE